MVSVVRFCPISYDWVGFSMGFLVQFGRAVCFQVQSDKVMYY
jgi:hypothetical protein